MGGNVKIKDLEVKAGKVISVSLSGDALDLFTMAIGEVETAQANTKHMQRPLARKFTSLIAKMKALQLDLEKHDKYVADLEARKEERHDYTMMRQIVKMSNKARIPIAMKLMADDWSQNPNVMEGR